MMSTIQATGPKPLVLDHFRYAPVPDSITGRKGGVVIRPIWPEPTTERGDLQLKS